MKSVPCREKVPNQAKSHQKNGAPTRHLRVIERHVNGESNREITRQEGIGRDKVGLILSQREVVQKIAQCRTRLLDLVSAGDQCVR
jgi:hypothetical protein